MKIIRPTVSRTLKVLAKQYEGLFLSLYEAHWNRLIVDNTNMLFRNKVKSKFSSQVSKELANNKDKNIVKYSYVSTLLSSIPAKSPKKVNKISKYFKKNPSSIQKKSYA